jgi:hypothetical protein
MSAVQGRIGRKYLWCAQCGKEPVRHFGDVCGGCRLSARLSTRDEKLAWLLAHPAIWEGFPREDRPNHARLIFMSMQKAGLYSLTTCWQDADIYGLISDTRKLRRESQ